MHVDGMTHALGPERQWQTSINQQRTHGGKKDTNVPLRLSILPGCIGTGKLVFYAMDSQKGGYCV